MNIEDYISSGILESYLLGELDERDGALVEQMIAKHPEIKKELEQLENTLEMIYHKTAVSPPGSLKDQVRSRLGLEASDRQDPKAIAKPSSHSSFRYAIAASVSIAIMASAMAFYFYSQWQSTKIQLQNLVAQHQQVAVDHQWVNQQLQTLQKEKEVLGNPEYIRILMQGTANAPSSLATVYWNDNTQEVYLNTQSLQKLPVDKQYQLWAIVEDKPIAIGVFSHSEQLLQMQSIDRATAFAVTVEPQGGSPTPTLETMQVIGSI